MVNHMSENGTKKIFKFTHRVCWGAKLAKPVTKGSRDHREWLRGSVLSTYSHITTTIYHSIPTINGTLLVFAYVENCQHPDSNARPAEQHTTIHIM